jgi:heparan-alpha-glucosaminide N-acetyltransferase
MTAIESPAPRLFFLDAFRGFTMVCMIGAGFGVPYFARHPWIGPIARQFGHAPWEGMTAWDLVMPFFLGVVGAVMPVSFARRWAKGESWGASLRHVVKRCLLMVALGLFIGSVQAGKPTLYLMDVLPHIALAYLVAFLVLRGSWRVKLGTGIGILAAHWALYAFASAPGVTGAFAKEANIGWYLDKLILGRNWPGGYATINAVASTVNVLAGVLAGELLASGRTARQKMAALGAAAAACGGVGWALSIWIPVIKHIWTASFTFFSIGWTLLALLLFYWVCEVKQWRRWARVFLMVGANSLFIYVFHESTARYLNSVAATFLDWTVPLWGEWGWLLKAWAVTGFEIYLCYWLYQRKIFFKL